MQPKKYSIVCYLEGESESRVRAIQEKLFELTGSRKCLDAWTPHLTLGSGIIVSSEQQEAVDKAFERLAESQATFTTTLSGLGGTKSWKGAVEGLTTPYVLWINVEVSKELQKLFDLIADSITSAYETFYPRIVEYVPHVTVAYGDLTEAGYAIGEECLKTINFRDEIEISHVALVENFPEKDVEYKRFYFKNRNRPK